METNAIQNKFLRYGLWGLELAECISFVEWLEDEQMLREDTSANQVIQRLLDMHYAYHYKVLYNTIHRRDFEIEEPKGFWRLRPRKAENVSPNSIFAKLAKNGILFVPGEPFDVHRESSQREFFHYIWPLLSEKGCCWFD